MAHILRTPQADADLAEIWAYIARDNPAADKLIRQIDAAFEMAAGRLRFGHSSRATPPVINAQRHWQWCRTAVEFRCRTGRVVDRVL